MKTPASSPDLPSVPARWAWHYGRLLALRGRLQAATGVCLAAAAEPLELHGAAMADSATDESDHDLALGILAREQDALQEVDAALRRILEGGYGVCEETGRPIPAARLRAVPWTRHVREVEVDIERAQRLAETGSAS